MGQGPTMERKIARESGFMVDAEFVLPWMQRAENDIASARYLAETMRPAWFARRNGEQQTSVPQDRRSPVIASVAKQSTGNTPSQSGK